MISKKKTAQFYKYITYHPIRCSDRKALRGMVRTRHQVSSAPVDEMETSGRGASNGTQPFDKFVVIEGREYDITSFAKRHPGGNVLLSYEGQDGTAAYTEFHSNSTKANAILRNLPSRPARSPLLEPKEARIMQEYAEWRKSLADRGFFKVSQLHIALRLSELVAWVAAACWCLHAHGSILLGVLCFTMFNVRCGWIQHEAGHNSFTTNIKLDKLIQTLTVGLGLSTSGYQWNKMHNKHHATPNKVNSDIDLDTLPLVAFFVGAMEKNKRKRPVSALWLKLQALTFVPFTCGLVAHFWIYILHPMNALRKDKLGLLIMALSHTLKPAAFVYLGGLTVGSGYLMFVICNWLAAVYLFGHFSLSHTFMPEVDEDDHVTWVRFAMEHTVDISPNNPFIDYVMGFLNYQVIHHLFPAMPQFRGPAVSKELRQKAKDWGVEYHTMSYPSAWKSMLGNLDEVGSHYYELLNMPRPQKSMSSRGRTRSPDSPKSTSSFESD